MTIKVEFYSQLRDIVGTGELAVTLPDDATIETLLGELFARHPELATWNTRLLLAADLDYVDRTHAIKPGEVISIMPPVQGG